MYGAARRFWSSADTRGVGPRRSRAALAAGIAAAGGDAYARRRPADTGGGDPVKRLGLDLGAVVSASHNPFGDNGIKFFSAAGTKLDDETEARMEALVDAEADRIADPGRVRDLNGGLKDYLRGPRPPSPRPLGRRVVLDCANGATYRAAPAIFERLGAEVETIAAEPDGRNINDGCGSTHREHWSRRCRLEAEIGFAFDGDGDRVPRRRRQRPTTMAMSRSPWLPADGRTAASSAAGSRSP